MDRSLLTFNEAAFICNVYVPPINSKLRRNTNFDFFEEIETGLERYKTQGKCFVTGDFNSRTDRPVILKYDIFVTDGSELSNDVYITTPRASRDHVTDTHGQHMIALCKSTSFVVGNSRLHDDDNIGEFTFCSKDGLSVVDNFLLQKQDFSYVTDFEILN